MTRTENEADDLLDAVQELTRGVSRKETQEIRKNGRPIGTQRITVKTPALLKQLDEAIRSNMGSTTAGASDPATRSVINIGALLKLVQISSQITDWARVAGATITKDDAAATLDAWYAKVLSRTDLASGFYITKLHSWAGQIKAVLDPPRESDLPNACPVCGATEWWNPETRERYYRPLIIRYRPTGADMIQKAVAMCRACEHTWGVRELAYALEVAEREQGETA